MTTDEISLLKAEAERLRDLLNRANLTRDEEAVVLKLGTLETANAMLTAENERLRAALVTISLMEMQHEHDLFSATRVAEAALQELRT